MKKRILIITFLVSLLFAISSIPTFAHVVVKPSEVGVGKFQTFTVGVPNESDDQVTVGLRLLIPKGLEHVSPNVKPGWNIEVKHTEGMTEEGHGKITEIIWTGGTIPAGQRDDFLFSAKVPTEATTISWKAYQTYADGRVVAWDLNPDAEQPKDTDGNPDFSTKGPLSQTNIIDDLKPTKPEDDRNKNVPLILSSLALITAGAALAISIRKKK